MIDEERFLKFQEFMQRGVDAQRLREVMAQKGLDYDEYAGELYRRNRANFAETASAAGLPATQDVPEGQGFADAFLTNVGDSLRTIDSYSKAIGEAGEPIPKALNAPRGLVDFTAGVANIPEVYMDMQRQITKFGLTPTDPNPEPALQEASEKLKESAVLPHLKKLDSFVEGVEGLSDEESSPLYQEKIAPKIRFMGELADVLIGAGTIRAGVKKGTEQISKLGKVFKRVTDLGELRIGENFSTGIPGLRTIHNTRELDMLEKLAKSDIRPTSADWWLNMSRDNFLEGSLSRHIANDPSAKLAMMPDTTEVYNAKAAVNFMYNIKRGAIPATKENLARAFDIAKGIDQFSDDLVEAVNPYRDVQTVQNSYEQASKNINDFRRRTFQTGDEDLGQIDNYLNAVRTHYQHLVDHQHAIKVLGEEVRDRSLYGAVRALRDIGNRKDVPLFQGTYRIYTPGDEIPTDAISLAKNAKVGRLDPEKVIFTGESYHDILNGRWVVPQEAGVPAKFVEDPLTEEEFLDLGMYMFSKRLVEDGASRQIDKQTFLHWRRFLDDMEKNARMWHQKTGDDTYLSSLELIQKQQKNIDINLKYVGMPVSGEDLKLHAQLIRDFEVKYTKKELPAGSPFKNGFQWLDERAARFTDYERRNVIERAHEVGLLSDDMVRAILERNENHTPIRILMDVMGDPFIGAKESPSRKILLRDLGKKKQQGKEPLGLQQAKVLYNKKYTYVNPLEEIITRTEASTAFYERQRLANKVVEAYKQVNAVKQIDPGFDTEPTIASLEKYLDNMTDFQMGRVNALPGGFQPENSIRVYNNGKVEYWQAPPDLVSAVAGMTPKEWGRIMKIMGGAAHALRLGATSTPKFFLRNIRRDPLTQWLFTEEGGIPMWDSLIGLMHYIGKTDVWEEFARSGMGHATQSTLEADFKALQGITYEALASGKPYLFSRGSHKYSAKAAKTKGFESIKNRAKAAALTPYEFMRGMGEMGEQATRLGHFARLKDMQKIATGEGGSLASKGLKFFNDWTAGLEDALWTTAKTGSFKEGKKAFKKFKNRQFEYLDMLEDVREGTLDFHKMGEHIRTYNNLRAFTNAGIQDMDKFARAMAKRPFTTAIRGNLAITLPSWYFWNKWKDDPSYQKEPEYKRAMFWYIGKHENGDWIRWPKPFLPGVIFGTLAEKLLQAAYERDPENVSLRSKEFWGEFIDPEFWAASSTQRQLLSGAGAVLNAAPTEMIGGANLLNMAPGGEGYNLFRDSIVPAAPDSVQTLYGGASNEDTFRKREISPGYLGSGAPGYKFTERTSPALVELGKKFPNIVNPEVAEWAIEDVLGGTGRLAINVADQMTRVAQGEKLDPTMDQFLQNLGLTDKASSGFGSEPVRRFFEVRDALTYVHDTEIQMKRQLDNDRIPYEQYDEFMDENEWKVKLYKKWDKTSRKLSKLAKERSEASSSIEDKKKREEILALIDEEIELTAKNRLEEYELEMEYYERQRR